MQDINNSGKPHRVSGPERISPMIFDNLEYAGAFALPRLGVRMLAAKLRQPERVTHVGLNLLREGLIVLLRRTYLVQGLLTRLAKFDP